MKNSNKKRKIVKPTQQQLFKRLLASPQAGIDASYGEMLSFHICQDTKADIAESQFTDLIETLCDPESNKANIIKQLDDTINEYECLISALEGVQSDYHALCVSELGGKALDGLR